MSCRSVRVNKLVRPTVVVGPEMFPYNARDTCNVDIKTPSTRADKG